MPTIRGKFRARQFVPAAFAGLCSHALSFCTGWLTGQLFKPAPGEGFQDLAAVIIVFILTEIALMLAVVAGAALLASRKRRDGAFGLVAGWFVGLIVLVILWKTS